MTLGQNNTSRGPHLHRIVPPIIFRAAQTTERELRTPALSASNSFDEARLTSSEYTFKRLAHEILRNEIDQQQSLHTMSNQLLYYQI